MARTSSSRASKSIGTAQAAAQLVHAHIEAIELIDESDKEKWSEIVSLALDGGLRRDQLAASFSCNLMTINRWSAGQNAPAPMARKAIKVELMKQLGVLEASCANGTVRSHLEVSAAAD